MTSEKTRFAWVFNLDAELELSVGRGYSPRSRLLSQLGTYGADSQRLLGPDDLIAYPRAHGDFRSVDAEQARLLVGRAWCPTPRALSALAELGIMAEPHPDDRVLARVNHRRFACELGGGLDGQRYVEHRLELEPELRTAREPLLLKRPLAFAGRGQLRVYEYSRITDKEWSWIDASFRNDGLLVEPLVEVSAEFSLHGFIWRDGRFELGKPCLQTVSERGVFRAARRAELHELERSERDALYESGDCVARALSQAAYFGPFGIDAYRYRRGADRGFCRLSEINARYTMGFAAGFGRPASELLL